MTVLRALRLKHKLTHQQAADRMGVSRGHFIKLERIERGLNEHTIGLAAKAFGVSKAEILAETKLRIVRDDERNRDDEPNKVDGIVEIDVRAGLGGGGISGREVVRNGDYSDPVKSEGWRFPAQFLRNELRAPANQIIIVECQGDSMSPTLHSGDRVIVDTGHKLPTPDGIYCMRDRWGGIVVKRLQVLRRGEPPRVLVISDNESHQNEEVGADEIDVVGRVVCAMKLL